MLIKYKPWNKKLAKIQLDKTDFIRNLLVVYFFVVQTFKSCYSVQKRTLNEMKVDFDSFAM